MENAAKALSIAGAVLIGIMIIAVLLIMVNNIGDVHQKTEEEKRKEQIITFNKEYESYDKSLMRGTDVISVINRANNNNLKEAYDSEGNITNEFARIKTTLKIINEIIVYDNNRQPTTIMPANTYQIENYNMKINGTGNTYSKNLGDGIGIYTKVLENEED